MIAFVAANLRGAFVVEPAPVNDERGWFARTYCRSEFGDHGVDFVPAQTAVSHNARRGTLRGMHYQDEPFAESKLVRCTKGSLYDVIVDLRRSEPTFRQWQAVELTESNLFAVFIPPGVAHGYQTLEDDTEVAYEIAPEYNPAYARGVRWDDPTFGIDWPLPVTGISERDRSYADYSWAL